MKKKLSVVACLLLSTVMLTGCPGGSSVLTEYSEYDNSVIGYGYGFNDGGYVEKSFSASSGSDFTDYQTDYSDLDDYWQQSESDIVAMKQMLIRNASVELKVDSTESFDTWLQERVAEYGGYFESHDIRSWNSEYSTSRNSWFKVRVNQEKLDDFLTSMDDVGTMIRKSISTTDVSLEYSDTEANLKAPRNERGNLERLMSEAQSVSDVMEISGRISELNGLIESLEKRRRGLENQVTYSTVDISITEEREISNPVSLAFRVNFRERFIYAIENFMDMFVGFVFGLPMLALGIFIFVLSMWILRLFWRLIMRHKKGSGPAFYYALMPVANPVSEEDVSKKSKKGVFGKNAKIDASVELSSAESKDIVKVDKSVISEDQNADIVKSDDVIEKH